MKRNLRNEIMLQFYNAGFRITAEKTLQPSKDQVRQHLQYREDNMERMAKAVLNNCARHNINPNDTFLAGMSVSEIGDRIEEFDIEYLTSGKVFAAIICGQDAIGKVKEICGSTFPAEADPQSIRGKFGSDSFEKCTREKRSVHNLVHAAADREEAAIHAAIWLPGFNYQ